MNGSPTINAHFIPVSIIKDILEGKDMNLASLLISVHDLFKNNSYVWGMSGWW